MCPENRFKFNVLWAHLLGQLSALWSACPKIDASSYIGYRPAPMKLCLRSLATTLVACVCLIVSGPAFGGAVPVIVSRTVTLGAELGRFIPLLANAQTRALSGLTQPPPDLIGCYDGSLLVRTQSTHLNMRQTAAVIRALNTADVVLGEDEIAGLVAQIPKTHGMVAASEPRLRRILRYPEESELFAARTYEVETFPTSQALSRDAAYAEDVESKLRLFYVTVLRLKTGLVPFANTMDPSQWSLLRPTGIDAALRRDLEKLVSELKVLREYIMRNVNSLDPKSHIVFSQASTTLGFIQSLLQDPLLKPLSPAQIEEIDQRNAAEIFFDVP